MRRMALIAALLAAVMLHGRAGAQSAVPVSEESRLLDRLTREPDYVPGYLDLARLYYDQRRLAEAEDALRAALTHLGRERVVGARRSSPPPRVGGEIQAPRKIRDAVPVYPETAQRANVRGVVLVDITIARDGTVRAATILRGQPLLNAAALDAVKRWIFEPAMMNGESTEVVMTVSLRIPEN